MTNFDRIREGIIESVISVLLGEDLTKEQSLQENLQEAVNREAARMATGHDETPASFAAVEIIVSKMNLLQSTVDFAVGKCLEIYERGKNDPFDIHNFDALNAAIKLLRYGASREMIEKVIGAVAEHGWHGRIEGLAQKFLGRGLTPAEVKALVHHYVNDKGSRGSDTEEKLLEMARKYMSPEDAAEIASQIQHFVTEFEEQDWG